MRSINLESCIVDGVNCVEVYICTVPPPKKSESAKPVLAESLTTIDISWNPSFDLSKILKNYMNFKNTTEVVEYYHRDLCYTYDRANDGQRVSRKKFKKDISNDFSYAVGYNEEILPSHLYPCVDEKTYSTRIQRNSYRVNNRMYIIHDVELTTKIESMYIRYNHSNQVDLKKIEIDFQRAYNTLTKRN
jgi:hypothetical protein